MKSTAGAISTRAAGVAGLRDGSRRITHITEVLGLEGDVIITQDLFLYDILGEDANGKLIGRRQRQCKVGQVVEIGKILAL